MRRIAALSIALLLLLGSLLTIAPPSPVLAQDAATPAACAPAAPEANRQVALDWFQAITDGDLARFDTLMTPDARYHAASVTDVIGPAAARDIYQGALDGFPGIVYTPRDVVASGDYVAVRYTAEGDNTGPFRGAPATGAHAVWDGIGIMRFECGKIAEEWMEVDQIARMTALGATKETEVVRALAGRGTGADTAAATPESGQVPVPACPTATRREAEQVYFVWDEVWDTGDVALLDGMYTEAAATGDANSNGTPLQEELSAAVSAWKSAMPDLQDQTDLIFADGDHVVARWTARGTMTGDFFGVPATGQPVTYTGITMLRVECGRIAESWTEIDVASMLDAMKADWRK
jgi:steroid delta-isomerase-like uncharacterized protein